MKKYSTIAHYLISLAIILGTVHKAGASFGDDYHMRYEYRPSTNQHERRGLRGPQPAYYAPVDHARLERERLERVQAESTFNTDIAPILCDVFSGNNSFDAVYNRLTLGTLALPEPHNKALKICIYRLQNIFFDEDGKYLPHAIPEREELRAIIAVLRSYNMSESAINTLCVACNIPHYKEYCEQSFFESFTQGITGISSHVSECFCDTDKRNAQTTNHPYSKTLTQIIELCRKKEFAQAREVAFQLSDRYAYSLYRDLHAYYGANPPLEPPFVPLLEESGTSITDVSLKQDELPSLLQTSPQHNLAPHNGDPEGEPPRSITVAKIRDLPTLDLYTNERMVVRQNAMQHIEQHGRLITLEHYELTPASEQALGMYNIEHSLFRQCVGDQLQQALQADCVHIVNAFVGEQSELPAHLPYEASLFFKGTAITCQLNRDGNTDEASAMADACWEYCKAFGQGVWLGATNAIVAGLNPASTLTSAISVVCAVGKLSFRVSKGVVLAVVNPEQAVQDLYELEDKIEKSIAKVIHDIGSMSGPERVRTATMIATELLLARKISLGTAKVIALSKSNKYIKALLAYLDGKVAKVKEKIKSATGRPETIVATPEGIKVPIKNAIEQLPPAQPPRDLPHLPHMPHVDDYKLKKAIEHATTGTKLKHFFENNLHEHGFAEILSKMGDAKDINIQKQFVKDVLTQLAQSEKLPIDGVFKGITINVAGHLVECKGCMHEGILKLGSIFIRDKFKMK